ALPPGRRARADSRGDRGLRRPARSGGGVTSSAPLRLLVYDRTCARPLVPALGARGAFGLTTAWSAGSVLYRALGRLDAAYGATSWEDGLGWLASFRASHRIGEIQYWGHGKWGCARVGRDGLDAQAL